MRKRLAAAAMVAFCASAHLAHADCSKQAPGFAMAYCSASVYADAAEALNQVYQFLMQAMSPADRRDLLHEQVAWLEQRRRQCAIADRGQTFIDYACAIAMTRARIAALEGRFGTKRTKATAIDSPRAID